jgi:hypothetical protein
MTAPDRVPEDGDVPVTEMAKGFGRLLDISELRN